MADPTGAFTGALVAEGEDASNPVTRAGAQPAAIKMLTLARAEVQLRLPTSLEMDEIVLFIHFASNGGCK